MRRARWAVGFDHVTFTNFNLIRVPSSGVSHFGINASQYQKN